MNMKKAAICAAAMMVMTVFPSCGQDLPEGPADAVVGENAFIITLYPDVAPITCKNFQKLVNEGFYNGLTFHRVVDDFMAQGGDPDGTGAGGSPETIKGEFQSNGVKNNLSHQRGVVSMARTNDPNSASSQFFICYDDCSQWLDGNYAAFGEVKEGMEVVDSFLEVERDYNGGGELASPVNPIVMECVWPIEKDAEGHPRVEVKMMPIVKAEPAPEEEPAEEAAPVEESVPEEESAPAEEPAADEESAPEEDAAPAEESETPEE